MYLVKRGSAHLCGVVFLIMKKRTLYTLPKGTDILDGEVIANAIKANKNNLKIFKRLESYMDDSPEMERQSPNALLTINNFADYITSINTGYLVGNPIDYKAGGKDDISALIDAYKAQSIEELDTDIAEDLSIFGQAFETVYLDEESEILSSKLSVYNTIVIYDDTFKHEKMAALYYAQLDNSKDDYDVTIWTPSHIYNRKLAGSDLTEDANNPDREHFFGEVPVIHYLNNRRLKGDFEPVISLIDAYNILQSDRVLDREKLVDAILAFYGARLTKEDQEAIKENRTIGLPEGSKAEYLIKNIDEADADVLRQTIAADIHKFSKTPDLTDETFGNAPSGVSILYKLLAFEQNVKKKERLLAAGLRNRLELYLTMLRRKSKISAVNVDAIKLVFRRALPKNDFETSQIINNLDGKVDDETLVAQLSFVDDAADVVKKARQERDERLELSNFGTDKPDEGDEDGA